MKKLLLIALATTPVLMQSCKKEEHNITTKQPQNIYKQQGWGLNNTWNGTDCNPTPKDCFDEIVVVGEPTVIQDFHGAISAGPSAVADFFNSAGGAQLFPGLYQPEFEEQLNLLISGTARIERKSGVRNYYLVYDENDNFIFALQIVIRRP